MEPIKANVRKAQGPCFWANAAWCFLGDNVRCREHFVVVRAFLVLLVLPVSLEEVMVTRSPPGILIKSSVTLMPRRSDVTGGLGGVLPENLRARQEKGGVGLTQAAKELVVSVLQQALLQLDVHLQLPCLLMGPLGSSSKPSSWRHFLGWVLLQLLLAFCLFSYLRVPPGKTPTNPANKSRPLNTTSPPLLILLWTWPFNVPVPLSPCSSLQPGTATCQLTASRSMYQQADAVLIHHREVSVNVRTKLPRSPRPPGQRWVWFSMESPSHCPHLKDLDGYFNLTMSYRADSDIFTPYGWLEPWPGQWADVLAHLSAKTKLVVWVISNWQASSARVRYYKQLQLHLDVDVFGSSHRPLSSDTMMEQLAQYKFYLAFENSLHQDYITEKLWRNALQAWAVPVVLGPSRANYERFLPPEAFIHVDDFPSPQALAQHLQALDKDQANYQKYFRWRETLRPCSFNWNLNYCKACWELQQGARYQTVHSIASWFT
ncbi:PREDICTED: galactoside 3(4)-L-fucosyltransferase [Elephantulus edwardii]|uniref:galactoside 3(4)-L-fucosyltransferase n=1 Tax=Elephantulus edwardii TaxID=28737 RepID=UPI0003F0E2A3|nr:PREDICTED: galactoside 3(4)-L-fucosyltransferase [Elephantulus edwardii]